MVTDNNNVLPVQNEAVADGVRTTGNVLPEFTRVSAVVTLHPAPSVTVTLYIPGAALASVAPV